MLFLMLLPYTYVRIHAVRANAAVKEKHTRPREIVKEEEEGEEEEDESGGEEEEEEEE